MPSPYLEELIHQAILLTSTRIVTGICYYIIGRIFLAATPARTTIRVFFFLRMEKLIRGTELEATLTNFFPPIHWSDDLKQAAQCAFVARHG